MTHAKKILAKLFADGKLKAATDDGEPEGIPPGCDKCNGEPMVHIRTDENGNSFAGRCSCRRGRYFAAMDRTRERRAA